MSKPNPDDLLSRQEAAAYTGFSPLYLAQEAVAGRFVTPSKRVGQSFLYRRRNIDTWRADRVKNGRPRLQYPKRKRG